MSSKMKIALVFEDLFVFHAPQNLDKSFGTWVLKIDSLSSDIPNSRSPSSFMTCPSIQGSIKHIKCEVYVHYAAVSYCTTTTYKSKSGQR